MLEVRSATRSALADISGGGFLIRSVASPGAVLVRGAVQPLSRQAGHPSNKENVPPVGALIAPKRRSPKPDWYPRTPLRDITSIVKEDNGIAYECIGWHTSSTVGTSCLYLSLLDVRNLIS
ncbi:unnamed protein product [Urochloa humidicola]